MTSETALLTLPLGANPSTLRETTDLELGKFTMNLGKSVSKIVVGLLLHSCAIIFI